MGDIPQDHGLAKSLSTRLLEQYNQCGSQQVAQLSTNYRCHRDILELARDLFYDHKLHACAKNTAIPKVKHPLWFVCTSFDKELPVDKADDEGEAKALTAQLKRFFNTSEMQNINVCIMTCNRRQVRLESYLTNNFTLF